MSTHGVSLRLETSTAMRNSYVIIVAFFLGCLFSPITKAQWVEGFALPGVYNSEVVAVAGDKIFVTGSELAGSEVTNLKTAAYSLTDEVWTTLEDWPESNAIRHMVADSNGGLYVTGSFVEVAGLEVNRIAHYDVGSGQWTALGSGLSSIPSAITVHENTLYVAHKVGVLVRVMTWVNNEWSLLGEIEGSVYDLTVGDGRLYVAGEFSGIGDIESVGVLAYDLDDALWQPVGKGVTHEHNPSLARVFNLGWYEGVLYLSGFFTHGVLEDGQVISAPMAASWNVAQQIWQYEETLGGGVIFGNDAAGNFYAGLNMRVRDEWVDVSGAQIPYNHGGMELHSILPYGEGLLLGYSAFYLPTEGVEQTRQVLYTLDPATETWGVIANQASSGVDKMVYALASDDQKGVYAGGNFRFTGSLNAPSIAYLHDFTWYPLGGGTNRDVQALHIAESGKVYVGGDFSAVYQESEEAVSSRAIAMWNPADQQWKALGGGVGFSNGNAGRVNAIAETSDGKIVVAGSFSQVFQPDGQTHAVDHVARWNPTENLWEVLPQDHGIPRIYALAVDDAGNTYIGGDNRMEASGVSRVAMLPTGGTEWSVLRDWPTSLMIMDFAMWGNPTGSNGELYVATFGNGVWRWSNSQWQLVGGAQYATAVAMNGIPGQGGELYVGDYSLRNLCLWRGDDWGSVPGSNLWGEGLYYYGGPTIALEVMPTSANEATLWVGGSVLGVNGNVSAGIAAYETVNYVSNEGSPDSGEVHITLSAYPNPVTTQATVSVSIPTAGDVSIHVYDVMGRRVMTRVDEFRPAGVFDVELNTASLSAGVYIVRLTIGGHTEVQRITVVR